MNSNDIGIAEARNRLRENAQNEATCIALNDMLKDAQEEVRRLREENERLRKDAERLDWLLSDFGKHCFSVDHAWDGESDLRPVIDVVRSTK